VVDSLKRKSQKRKREPGERGADKRGIESLDRAHEEWRWGVLERSPKDARALQMADVLVTLRWCAALPEDERLRAALEEIAAIARKAARDTPGTFIRSLSTDAPRVLEWIESHVQAYPSRTEEERQRTVLQIACELQFRRYLFGPPARPERELPERLRAVLDTPDRDIERTVKRILIAYGMPVNKARNAYKFRDMHSKPRSSSIE
jgi:hypothetical protein